MNPRPFPPQSVISANGTTPCVPSTNVERAVPSAGPVPGARPLIELHSVTKSFGSPGREEHALRSVSLSIGAGEFVGVVGKSGSGKSTLLNMITGIDRPTEGGITVDGTRVDQLDEEERAVWRGRKVGIVFQFFQLLPTLSVLENVMLPMDFSGAYPGEERRRRAEALLGLVGIPEQAGKLPSALSGGQQQRAAIARALANDPPLIVADEPTGNLDSVTALNVVALFGRLVEQGRTVVVVTHEREVANYVHRVVRLRDGRIEAETPGALDYAHLGGPRS